ncbi:MAG: FAD:protein FMN transferase [Planctomycetota bacterium]
MVWRIFLAAAGCTLWSAAAAAEEPLKISGKTMGSYYAITIDEPGGADAVRLQRDIEQLLSDLNRQMSTWDDSSQISQFNRLRSTDWFPVGRELADVTTEALRLHQLTDGALDITLAPLIEAWGFGRSRRPRVPPDAEISKALADMGPQHLEVRQDPPAIRKQRPALQISVNALAPGYAADCISRLLNARGLKSHVVDVGGENLAGAAKRSGDPWRIGVESPLGGLQRVLPLTHMAAATSGDYRNFREINGRRYSHVLNPRTGHPVEDPPAAVCVLHPSCMTADGLCTALMVLGPDAGLRLAAQVGFDVMFLDLDPDGKLIEHSSGRFLEAAK